MVIATLKLPDGRVFDYADEKDSAGQNRPE